MKLGFDVNIAGHAAGAPGSYQAEDHYGNNPDGSPKEPWGVPGLEKYYGTGTHLTDALANEACSAIAAADRSKPFFLYMATYAVHMPIQPHARFLADYLGKNYPGTDIAIPKIEAEYASMVAGYDAALGQILDQLNELGIAEQTLVVFTSDNGGLSAHSRGTTPRGTGLNTHCWPLREGKGSAYEGGTRVPLIVSWARPNDQNEMQRGFPIHPDTINNTPTICEDYFATILRWAGMETATFKDAEKKNDADSTPATSVQPKLVCDGIDLSPAILGGELQTPRALLFHYPHVWGPRRRLPTPQFA